MEEQTLTASDSKTSRRHFLDLLLGASVLGWLASIAYPIIRYLKPLPQTGPTGPTRLTREEAGKLEENKFVIVPVSGQRVIVLQSDDQLFAFSAKCTHEGCTVTFQPGAIGHLVSVSRWPLRSQRPRLFRAAAATASQIRRETTTRRRHRHLRREGLKLTTPKKRGGLLGWLDRRYQVTPLFDFFGTRKCR